MRRIPEPELMEDAEQAQAYSDADFSGAHDHLVATCTERLGPVTGAVVDLGCGPADVTVRFARANPECTVVGLDGAEAMLACGRERVLAEGLASRISLELALLPLAAPQHTSGAERYETILSSSLLHHLADPAALWETVAAVAAPGARVFVWDLRRPPTIDAARDLLERHAPEGEEVLRRDFYNSLLAAYEPAEVEAQLEAAGLRGLRVEAIGDRHLIVSGRLGD